MRPRTSTNSFKATLTALSLLFLFSFLFPLNAEEALSPIQAKQGEVIYLPLKLDSMSEPVTGRFLNQPIPIFKTTDGFGVLIGIDLETAPGLQIFEVTSKQGEATIVQKYPIQILSGSFEEQRINELPKAMVDPDAAALVRIEKEKERTLATFSKSSNEKLWEGSFLVPAEGRILGAFGSRRILNGQPRNRHSGEDIGAPLGSPVLATNGGKVALVGDFYFNGRSVFIDHGLGLFSMYFHLSEISVQQGTMVKRGQRIGSVGKTGRATGPHLHWGMRLHDARVNPFSLVEKKLN